MIYGRHSLMPYLSISIRISKDFLIIWILNLNAQSYIKCCMEITFLQLGYGYRFIIYEFLIYQYL